MSRSRNQILPELGAIWPEIMLMKVVLPAPLGPMTQQISPAPSAKSISWFATRPRKFFVSLSVRIRSAMAPSSARAIQNVLDGARDTAFEGDNDDHEDDAEHELPILRRDSREVIGEGGNGNGAEQCAEQRL